LIFLSEVLGLPVVDAARARVGRVRDLLVPSAEGVVERLLVTTAQGTVTIAWGAVKAVSPEKRRVVLNADAALEASPEDPEGELLGLSRDVLDRQIIDIQGRKVVRVNDIVLDGAHRTLRVLAAEVGLAGAVHRLLAGIVAPRHVRRLTAGLPHRLISWDYVGLVEPRSATIRLKVHQHLARMHPADLADIIEDLGRVERRAIVSGLDTETAADALAEAEPSVQAAVVDEIHPERAADILEEMPPDEAADILGELDSERSEAVLDAMEVDEARDVRELLAFPEDSAGGLMNSEFFRIAADWRPGDVLEALRGLDERLVDDTDEIPVVTESGQLVGMASLVLLARAASDQLARDCCRPEHVSVPPTLPFDEVAQLFSKYHLRALPVVDEFGTVVGLIGIQDVLHRLVGEERA